MQPNHDVEMRLDVKVPMRDGTGLSADIYLPRASGRFPTVLRRTPYSNNTPEMIEKGRRLANSGYVCVIMEGPPSDASQLHPTQAKMRQGE